MFIWPVPGYYTISSDYYDQRDYGLHGAIDIPAPAVPTIAIGAGTVIFVGWAGSAGRSVYLELEGGYRAHYCHLDTFNVTIGQAVAAGDVIGYVGGSGYEVDNYYGSHLHFNLFASQQPATGPSHWVGWVGMWAVDPELYLSKEDTMPSEHDQHHQQLADRMQAAEAHLARIQAWLEAHDNIAHAELNARIEALSGGGIKRGDTVKLT